MMILRVKYFYNKVVIDKRCRGNFFRTQCIFPPDSLLLCQCDIICQVRALQLQWRGA